MGLYGQRIGCLSLVCADKAEASAVESQVKVRALLILGVGMVADSFMPSSMLRHPVLCDRWHGHEHVHASFAIGVVGTSRARASEMLPGYESAYEI